MTKLKLEPTGFTTAEQITMLLDASEFDNRLEAAVFIYIYRTFMTEERFRHLELQSIAKQFAAFIAKHVHVDVDRE